MAKLESHQPLLALCSSHWKADHILGNTLLVQVAEHLEDNQSNPNKCTGSSHRSESKKWTGKHCSQERKRWKKNNGKAASTDKDGRKSDDMSISKRFNYIHNNSYSYSYSAPTPSNALEKNHDKVQMPSSSFMQGVNASTRPVAVDVSFIQVDTSSMSYAFTFYSVSY